VKDSKKLKLLFWWCEIF